MNELFEKSVSAVSNALAYYSKMSSFSVDSSEKETPRDLVTSMDILVQDCLINELKDSNIPIFSEEITKKDFNNSDIFWLIDPIDGTTNYVNKIKYFGIALSLVKNGFPEIGVFGMPETKEIFYMISKDIAYLNETKLEIKDKSISEGLLAVSFSSRRISSEEERNNEYLLFGENNDLSRGCLRMGSATANICYTAASRFVTCYGHKSFLWDVAAGVAIAKAAGCSIYLSEIDINHRVSYVIGSPTAANEIKQKIEHYLNVHMILC